MTGNGFVYITYLWWNGGWFIVVLPTLPEKAKQKEKKHLNPLRSGAMEGMETVDMEQLCFFESMVV